MIVPIVIEEGKRGERSYDIYSRLLKDRIILLTEVINDNLAANIIGQLLFLNSQNHEPIQLYINSAGGVVTSGLAIYDTMQFIKSPVHTLCLGQAASMAAILLAAGEPGKRSILPNARVMIHQPYGAVEGKETDIRIQAEQIEKTRKQLANILLKHTRSDVDLKHIQDMLEWDFWMTPEDAKLHKFVDNVLEKE